MQSAKLTLSRGCSASLPDRIQNNRQLALVPKLRKKTLFDGVPLKSSLATELDGGQYRQPVTVGMRPDPVGRDGKHLCYLGDGE
jgi:hypothetical protein